MILLADSEGSDQAEGVRRLIWAFAVRICLKTRFHMARPILFSAYGLRKKYESF